MQNVVLGAYVYTSTSSPGFTTFIVFAQTFPLLALSLLGGSLADTVDRRKLLVATQLWQAVCGLVLAGLLADGHVERTTLTAVVLLIGVGQAMYSPAFNAVVPSLVGPNNLSAAISLNSMMINGSRVIGPVLGAMAFGLWGASTVFVLNSVTYLGIIAVLLATKLPPKRTTRIKVADRIFGGLKLATRSPQVGTPLLIMTAFSLLCLPFIGLMPVIAEQSWKVDPQGGRYGLLYACFGLGALVGAASVGTALLRVPKALVVRSSLGGFAVSLAVLAIVDSAGPAYPMLFLVGLFYFTMPTALTTFLQEHLSDEIRGRVMALWTISFGGVISIANLVSGTIVEQTSLRLVLLTGALAAALLGLSLRLEPGAIVDESLLAVERIPRRRTARLFSRQ